MYCSMSCVRHNLNFDLTLAEIKLYIYIASELFSSLFVQRVAVAELDEEGIVGLLKEGGLSRSQTPPMKPTILMTNCRVNARRTL